MVANPMQKKARNSFLLGMIITLLVCAIIGGLFYVLVIRKNEQKKDEEGELTYVYRLKNDVQSGHKVEVTDVESIVVTSKAVPADAFASKTKTKNEKGKEVWKDKAFTEGYNAKVDLKAGTILSSNLLYQGDAVTADVRYVEYNMLTLPTTVDVGDFIDIRLTLPNGQDLIVVSKKEIKTIIGNTIGLDLTEGDILMMESAIVEAYIMTASKLYVTQYVEPGDQTASLKTYTPTQEVQDLINATNNNIQETAKDALVARFSSSVRTNINNSKSSYSENETENIETKLKEEIENAKAAREAYLSGLTSY